MMSQVGKNVVMIFTSDHLFTPLSSLLLSSSPFSSFSSLSSFLLSYCLLWPPLFCPPLQLFAENLQRSVQVSAPSEVQVSHPPRSKVHLL